MNEPQVQLAQYVRVDASSVLLARVPEPCLEGHPAGAPGRRPPAERAASPRRPGGAAHVCGLLPAAVSVTASVSLAKAKGPCRPGALRSWNPD
eukprot:CAMPEP_0206039700 /NCGR_PEP_ID=MMETSP1466-20131121/4917_1 /ASSEMBLY_ACC=CAM_ASM_001126 /TAXON_ID=44452 /ORGANISM="Pavlova gyrans, Strain CCMP608" /LENGTH=92 /DNA_ID=CAMNT_0053414351 /DNA_START=681 /DNA_END=959 /DNA_ORIENTATION=+